MQTAILQIAALIAALSLIAAIGGGVIAATHSSADGYGAIRIRWRYRIHRGNTGNAAGYAPAIAPYRLRPPQSQRAQRHYIFGGNRMEFCINHEHLGLAAIVGFWLIGGWALTYRLKRWREED